MSLKEASFRVHHLVQNIFQCSYFLDIEKNILIPHPLYNTKIHQIYRTLVYMVCIIGIPITTFYLCWLFIQRSHINETDYAIQFIVYTVMVPVLVLFNYSNFLIIARSKERQYLQYEA